MKQIQKNKKEIEQRNDVSHLGFTLAEMMVVMLILRIVLAASMPIITKRVHHSSTAATEMDHGHIQYNWAPNGKGYVNGNRTPQECSFTVPKGVTKIIIDGIGGGGGGGGYGGAGGDGGNSASGSSCSKLKNCGSGVLLCECAGAPTTGTQGGRGGNGANGGNGGNGYWFIGKSVKVIQLQKYIITIGTGGAPGVSG